MTTLSQLFFRGLMVVGLVLGFSSPSFAKKLKVVTTFTVIADMARNVAGDHADVVSVTKPGAEIHNYQPTPRDIVRASDADLILWNGMGLELWFEKFLGHLGKVPAVTVSDGVKPMSITRGPYDGRPNPHAWMSPAAAIIYVDNILAGLVRFDSANAQHYEVNAKAYKAKILALSEPLRAEFKKLPENRRWLVSSEGAFSYLARDFGLNELYLWPINADAQGTPKQVRRVIDTMRKHKIPVLFSESTVSDKPARQIARETGAKYGGILYVDSLSGPDGPVPTYLDLLRVTSHTIAKGLQQ